MKIAIVTGASSGMGRETARQIADRYAGIEEIWIVARRSQRLRELEEQLPVRVRCFAADITCPQQRESLREALRACQPNVKFLVNAAGFGKIGRVGELDEETECAMVRLNCEALCAVTHMVLPYMSPNSRILQFASAAAFLPQPSFAIYAASKSFVLSYSRALNEELKNRNICVTAVCPGPVRTEFFDIAETTGRIPFYKQMVMADCAQVVRQALRDCAMGRPVSVYGYSMQALRLACRLIPHSLLLNAYTWCNRCLPMLSPGTGRRRGLRARRGGRRIS